VLTVPPRIERELIRASKRAFPVEAFGYLLGTIAGDSVQVDEVYWPEDALDSATDRNVPIKPEWAVDAEEHAQESGLTMVGWCHSHPYRYAEHAGLVTDHAQSEGDLECGIRLPVSAVCVVQDVGRRKRRLRASLRYWGPTLPVEVRRS
jgi:proteasome lid subunit RPN8/RPN11